jgi:hypothetical protein
MVIFDCNGGLVDSEPIAAAVLSEALGRIGITLSAAGFMAAGPPTFSPRSKRPPESSCRPISPVLSRRKRCAACAASCGRSRMPRTR